MSIPAIALTALAGAARQAELAADGLSRAGGAGAAADVAEEAVRLIAAQRQFETALRVAQAGDEMARRTLDLLA
jgi:flagellar basal body rod protein FlgF